MTNKTFLKVFNNPAELLGIGQNMLVDIREVYEGPFPFCVSDFCFPRPVELVYQLAAAKVFEVTEGGEHYAVVVLCTKAEKEDDSYWAVYCSDRQVQGLDLTVSLDLIDIIQRDFGITDSAVIGEIRKGKWWNVVSDGYDCGFSNRMRAKQLFCTHTKAVVHNLVLDDLLNLEERLNRWINNEPDALAAPSGKTIELSDEDNFEEVKTFYDSAFIQHVMLAGERGTGKTTLARKAASLYDAVYLECQMHQSMEAWELRAHDRAWQGQVYTVLGKFAEAAHWIKQGKKVVLVLDEFLNLNPVFHTVVNSMLTLTENDTYIIETGRIIDQGDGIGITETVEVPSDMLWVVATSNIGARYQVDKMNPAVRARFLIILMNSNSARTRVILEKNLNKYSMPLDLAVMFERFMSAANKNVDDNMLDEEVTTRLACNVIRNVALRVKRDKLSIRGLSSWVTLIKEQVTREIAQVVNIDRGTLDEDQTKCFNLLLSAFSNR